MRKVNFFIMPENHMENLYSSSNYLVRYVHRNRLKEIIKIVNEISNKFFQDGHLKLLDAGCGEGHFLKELNSENSRYSLFGADMSEIALKQARGRCDFANFVFADLRKMEFPDNYFDIIVCTETIEHISEYNQVLEEFQRILKPGGSLIITFPNEPMWIIGRFLLRRDPIKVPDHINSFTPNIMKKTINMDLVYKRNLPLEFVPNLISLGYLMHFRLH